MSHRFMVIHHCDIIFIFYLDESNVFIIEYQSNLFFFHSYSIGEIKLNISHCNKVIIKPETFSQVSLWGTFESIKNLNMKEGAFSRVMNSTRLIVINSYMSELNYLGAAFRQMSFNNCNIRTILPRAFDVININSITFDKCKIESIEENAITEKVNTFIFG